MGSPELLSVVESCPVGAETLILRILHILTENGIITLSLSVLFLNHKIVLVMHNNVIMISVEHYKELYKSLDNVTHLT